jgi:hypothetical protein
MKASPFASAAAAASVAARNSSAGAEALTAPPEPLSVPLSPPQQQQQEPGALSRMPSVPAAQAAAAAAAAAGQPLPPGSRPLRRQWSVNHSALQQQQPLGSRLSEQPSFLRRAAGALKHRLPVGDRDHHQQQQQQQQQLTSRPSVLEAALSVLLGPWRRLTASDTGDGHKHRPHDADASPALAAAADLEHGRVGARHPSGMAASSSVGPGSRLSSFMHGRGAGSTEYSHEPGSGSTTPRRLFKTFSLNLATAMGAGKGQQQQQGPGARRRTAVTTSSRLIGGAGREQVRDW